MNEQESNSEADAIFSEQDEYWMQYAMDLAAKGEVLGEVPVGAVIVQDDSVIGEGFNQPITSHDPTAHAEIIALRQAAARIENYRLIGSTIYVTLEPCTMCVGALVHARIARLVFGTTETKAGAVVSKSRLLDSDYFNHRVEYAGGLMAQQCQHQLSHFFAMRREQKRQEKLNSRNE
ncbi:tRNA adenosine(34) deaminase TadA [Cellvibrio sp. NN19]|uniref:tRNA adenosine(34) deaminase TadA n=1 Tax=Cellvibrio chitinivorans TaxID=3102792 RepID=UPI002B407BD0|nr:tRNA adenosine(34) deaminase TadA [Cellvibrio sp. NN19]